jgi:hypothetical protein
MIGFLELGIVLEISSYLTDEELVNKRLRFWMTQAMLNVILIEKKLTAKGIYFFSNQIND